MQKVLMIHHASNLGGGTLSCFDVISAMKDKEYNVTLALPQVEGAAKQKAKNMKIDLLTEVPPPLTFSYYNGSSNIFKALIKIAIICRYKKKWKILLQKEKPDLVILNSIVQWPLISILNSINIGNICFVRETMKGKPGGIINGLIKQRLSKATGVSFLSEYDERQWSLPNTVSQTIIPDLVDISSFEMGISKELSRSRLSLEQDVFYILYVGGMSKLKGADIIIKAMKKFKGQKIELLFLGDLGTDLSKGLKKIKNFSRIKFIRKIKKYVKGNNLSSNIRFIGLQDKMNYWYAACDVVVFPATKAHQARPIYEAGVFKKPVVVSNFPNFKEYLVPNKSGLVFEPGNYKELAKCIQRLYLDRSRIC